MSAIVKKAAGKQSKNRRRIDKLLNSRKWIGSVLVVGAMFIAGQAKADISYDWSFSVPTDGGSVTGSGLFSTAAQISGPTQLLTFTGAVDGIAITALLVPGSFNSNDNLVSDTPFYLDGSGVSFSLASADPTMGNTGNFYSSSQGYMANGSAGSSTTGFVYSLASSTDVPEPASMTLMITALAGLVAVQLRRNSRKAFGAPTHGCGWRQSQV